MEKQKRFRYYSILLVVFAFIVNYIQVALMVDGMNVLTGTLEQLYGWSRGAIAAPVSIGTLLSIISGFLIGSIIIKKGIQKVTVIGMVLIGICLIFMANSTSITMYSISIFLVLLLGPVLMMGTMAAISNWFIKKRGRVMGIVTIGAPVSSATFSLGATKFIAASSFATVYTGIGLFVILVGLFGIVACKSSPEELGLAPDGLDINSEEIKKLRSSEEAESTWNWKKILGNKEFWLVTLGWGFIFLMMTSIMSTFIPRFTDVGLDINLAFSILAGGSIIGIPISYLWGLLDDKVGTAKASAIYSLVFIIGAACVWNLSPDHMIFAYGVGLFLALATGGMPNLQPSLNTYVFGRKEFVNVSRYTGIGQQLFRAVSFAMMGYIFDVFGTYAPAYGLFIVLTFLTCLCFALIKVTYAPERSNLPNYKSPEDLDKSQVSQGV